MTCNRQTTMMTLRLPAVLTLLIFGLGIEGMAQQKRSFIPPPLKVEVSFDRAWDTISETLDEIDLEIAHQNRVKGAVVTKLRDYSSGPLVDNHIARIGEKPKLIDSQWLQVRYRYEVLVEFIHQKETLITVHADITALKREFLGTESWVQIATNGKLEEELLTRFGRRLFGQSFSLETPKKDFWDRSPSYLPTEKERNPKIIGPERPGQIGPIE